jgi:hypothetical protein
MANAKPDRDQLHDIRTAKPARCGFPRLFTSGAIPIAKTERETNTVRFLRVLALGSITDQHVTAPACNHNRRRWVPSRV